MEYRQIEGISKSSLGKLWKSVMDFQAYFNNEFNPLQPDHFVLGKYLEDLLMERNHENKYYFGELNIPTSEQQVKIWNLIQSHGELTGYLPLTDEHKLIIADKVGMSSPKVSEKRIEKVSLLDPLYDTYSALYRDKRVLVLPSIKERAEFMCKQLQEKAPEIYQGRTHESLVLKRTINGITVKGELDWVHETEEEIIITDLKNIGVPLSMYSWLNQVRKFAYRIQAYNYVELAKTNFNKPVRFRFLVVDYYGNVLVHNVNNQELRAGKQGYIVGNKEYPGFDQMFEKYCYYLDNYGTEVMDWPLVDWNLLQHQENQKYVLNGIEL